MCTLLDLLLPARCPICRRVAPVPCPACLDDLLPAPALLPPPGVDSCRVLVAYDEVGRLLVTRLKYRNARSALAWLAAAMAALVDPKRLEVVTWAPTSVARRRERGFDQAELLARAVARALRLPCRRLLRRGPGPPQTGRGLADRRAGPRFTARPLAPPGARVLLVDDVVTSGATVRAAATALRAAGASGVTVVAVARTPLKATSR